MCVPSPNRLILCRAVSTFVDRGRPGFTSTAGAGKTALGTARTNDRTCISLGGPNGRCRPTIGKVYPKSCLNFTLTTWKFGRERRLSPPITSQPKPAILASTLPRMLAGRPERFPRLAHSQEIHHPRYHLRVPPAFGPTRNPERQSWNGRSIAARAHPQTSWCRMHAAPGASRDLPKPIANTAFGSSIGSTIEWPTGGSPRTGLPCG